MEPLMDMQQPLEDLPEMDDSSNITLSLGSNSTENTVEGDGGPMHNILLDLNAPVLALGVPDMAPELQQPLQPFAALNHEVQQELPLVAEQHIAAIVP